MLNPPISDVGSTVVAYTTALAWIFIKINIVEKLPGNTRFSVRIEDYFSYQNRRIWQI